MRKSENVVMFARTLTACTNRPYSFVSPTQILVIQQRTKTNASHVATSNTNTNTKPFQLISLTLVETFTVPHCNNPNRLQSISTRIPPPWYQPSTTGYYLHRSAYQEPRASTRHCFQTLDMFPMSTIALIRGPFEALAG